MDALGKRALLDAWMLILQGRADEIASPPGAALTEFGKNSHTSS